MEVGRSIPSILAALEAKPGISGDIRDDNKLGVPDLEIDPGGPGVPGVPGVLERGIWYPLNSTSFCCCPRGGCGVAGRDRGFSNLKSEG